MFLNNRLLSIAAKQYFYKLKAHTSWALGLIFLQVLALLFSLTGIVSMSAGNGELSISLKYYSADIMIIFTLMWIVFVATRLTTKLSQTMDFTLVTNHLSSHLSNLGILLTASIFGSLTAPLTSFVLKTIMYISFDRSQIGFSGFHPVFSALFVGMIVTFLYLLLIAAASYLLGIFTQIHLLFALVFPACLLGLAIANPQPVNYVLNFFIAETSPLAFTGKVILSAAVFFCLSCLLSDRMEVGR